MKEYLNLAVKLLGLPEAERNEAVDKELSDISVEEREYIKAVLSGEKYPSLTSDVVAKRILDIDAHPDRFNYLLQVITGDKTIRVHHSVKNEGTVLSTNSKKLLFDINGMLFDERIACLEIQVVAQWFFNNRAELYDAELLMLQFSVKDGESKKKIGYENAKGAVLVFIFKDSPLELKTFETEHYIHRFNGLTADTGYKHPSLAHVVYVQLDKCYNQYKEGRDGENNPRLQLMLSMLYDANDIDVRRNAGKDPMMAEMLKESLLMTKDKEVLAMMLQEKYAEADWQSALKEATNVGISQGISQGINKGQIERQNKLLKKCFENVSSGSLDVSLAATLSEMTVNEFEEKMKKAGYKI